MPRNQFTHLKIILIISKRIFNSFSNLQPAKKEYELQNEEDWYKCIGVFIQLLAPNERQSKENVHSKLYNLKTRNPSGIAKNYSSEINNFLKSTNLLIHRRKYNMVMAINSLQTSLELCNVVNHDLGITWDELLLFGPEKIGNPNI